MKLTKEQVLKKIEELKQYIEKEEKQSYKIQGCWMPEKDQTYYIRDGHTYDAFNINIKLDLYAFLVNDLHKTKKEAKEHWKWLKTIGDIKEYILKTYPFEPDWSNEQQGKYYIDCYVKQDGSVSMYYAYSTKRYQLTWFPYVESSQAVEEIKEAYKEELEYIFNYAMGNKT